MKMCFSNGTTTYLRNGHVYEAVVNADGKKLRHTMVSRKEDTIQDFALYGLTERLEVTVDGQLTPVSSKEAIQIWSDSGKPRLSMAACCGGLWLLLCEDGRLLPNGTGLGWKDAVWIGSGLSTISAICGKERRLCSTVAHDPLTNVLEVVTYSSDWEYGSHFGAILQDGTLVVDDEEVGTASAVAICSKGIVFASGQKFLFYRFKSKDIQEVCPCNDKVLAMCIDDRAACQQPHLRIIWMTDTDILQQCHYL